MELFERDQSLRLSAANGTPLPYDGWIETQFQLLNCGKVQTVPMLVTTHEMESPVTGYNVTEEDVKQYCHEWQDDTVPPALYSHLSIAFSHDEQKKMNVSTPLKGHKVCGPWYDTSRETWDQNLKREHDTLEMSDLYKLHFCWGTSHFGAKDLRSVARRVRDQGDPIQNSTGVII